MAPVTESAYHARGALRRAAGIRQGAEWRRADIHFWADANGELFIMSKSDGMIARWLAPSA